MLVFLHHGLGSVSQWRDFPRRLSEATGCPALVYDRRGHGRSAALGGPRDHRYLHQEAEALAELLREEDVRDFVLIGHSDGGSIALLYPSVPGAVPPRGIITEAAHVFVEDCTRRGIREVLSGWRGRLRESLMRHHGAKTDELFLNWAGVWLSPSFDSFNITPELAAIRCPVLALQGGMDEFGSEAQLRALASCGAEVELIPGCRHEPHHEAVETVLGSMASWIGKLRIL